MSTAVAKHNRGQALAQLMRADAVLPRDIIPGAALDVTHRAALVTGATGFLGRYLLRELLARTGAEMICLIRAENTAQAQERLAQSLQQVGIDIAAYSGRLSVIAANVDDLQFGLSHADYGALADRVGRVFHCAADVNWARGYRQLRSSNVIGTLEVIRFACTGHRKRVLYSSTIAVCFGTEVPRQIDENTDMLDYIEHMPLAYAQTKCVSESLLRAASARGLPVSVIRPALISGDSRTGVANPQDLISALIQGCVVSGSAIDTDWNLDCVPVDYVARVLARLGEPGRPHWELLNLFHQQGRHWREVVLWMNLYGYPVELVAHSEWLHRTFDRLNARYSLFGYRRFFGAASARRSGPAPYESFLKYRQGQVQSTKTRDILDQLGITVPALDADLLERYLEHYESAGVLPCPRRARSRQHRQANGCDELRSILSPWLASHEMTLGHIREKSIATHDGIFNEVASARVGRAVGIRRFDVRVTRGDVGDEQLLEVLLKSKPTDSVMQNLLVEVAALCDPRLGRLCAAFKHELGLAGCHERELALYETAEPGLRHCMPRVFGTDRDSRRGIWSVAMEYLAEAESMNARRARWSRDEIRDAVSGLARLHAVYYRRSRDLRRIECLQSQPGVARMQEMTPFWLALAEFSARYFDSWLDDSIRPAQESFIANLSDWWPEMQALPVTLVHNDCNPRNLVLRRNGHALTPVFFDWELATIDVPQRDLAELLCFMMPDKSSAEELSAYLELHRCELEKATGFPIVADDCLKGFVFALRHLSINRLPLYTLMHRFRPQPFLPALVRNWKKLYRQASALDLQGATGDARRVATMRRAQSRPAVPQ